MRLTLRTLLAYLDDTLEPAEIKQIGQKVAESDTAQELIARIKQVTRRRRLTTPPLTGPNAKWDPNTVAEYLDNELSGEQIAELEKICLDSDVHLAEIAACHQILTLVLGEPALVPPTARERMYGLVKGREAIPFRKATAPAAASGDDTDVEDNPLLGLPFGRGQGNWVRWALPLAGVFLFVALGVALYFALPKGPPSGKPDQQANANKDDTKKDEVKADDTKKDDGKKDDTKKDDNARKDETKSDTKKDDSNKDESKKDDVKKDENKKDDVKKDDSGDREKIAPPPKPDNAVSDLGTYRGGLAGGPSVLVQRRKDTWARLSRGSAVTSGLTLVSLPGYASEVQLVSGVGLLLRGHVKELSPQLPGFAVLDNLMESSVILHKPPAGVAADLTLNQGRIYLTNRKDNGPALVRLRFRTEVWDVTLLEPGTEVGVDLLTQYTRDINYLDGGEPQVQVALCVLEGKAALRYDVYFLNSQEAPTVILWDNIGGAVQGPFRQPRVPPIWDKQFQSEKSATTLRDLKGMSEKLINKPVNVAMKDLFEDDATPLYQRVLALYGLSAVDEVEKLLDVLGNEDPTRALFRDVAIFTLRRWISRSNEAGNQLFNPKTKTGLLKKAQTSTEALTILVLLHDFKDEDRRKRETFDTLVGYLRSNKIAIRELALWHLVRLAGPAAPDVRYDPAAPPEQRNKAADEWQKLVDMGKLPPGSAPQKPMPMDKGMK